MALRRCHGDGARGVGAHELEVDALAGRSRGAPVGAPARRISLELGVEDAPDAGAGSRSPGPAIVRGSRRRRSPPRRRTSASAIARGAAGLLREDHRDVRGEVPVLGALGALDRPRGGVDVLAEADGPSAVIERVADSSARLMPLRT